MQQVVPESEGFHNSKHLSVSSTLVLLSLVQFAREDCDCLKRLVTWQSLQQSCTHSILAGICVDLYLFNIVRLEDLEYWGCWHCNLQLLKGFLALLVPLEDNVLLCEPGQR